jgi:hypothetical protein
LPGPVHTAPDALRGHHERRHGLNSVVQEMNHFTVFSPNGFSIKFHRDFTDHSIEVR